MPMDQVALNFSPQGLALLNAVLALVMFGIALDIHVSDFRRVASAPRSVLTGMAGQVLLLPALTWVLVLLLQPPPSIALGMMLVAACPGGNVSNFYTHVARGNTALSITLSGLSTLLSVLTTPLNLAFWASLYGPTAQLLKAVELDWGEMVRAVLLLLGLPLAAGLLLGRYRPALAARLRRPMRLLSLLAFGLFVLGALAANFHHLLAHAGLVAGYVVLHNGLALAGGYALARLVRLPRGDARAVTIEVGIQNSGLGLVLIFNFFGGLGGMALIAAAWGVWHLVSGGLLAAAWSRRPLADPAPAVGAAASPQAER